ncbi:hypothetical protein CEXT_551051 [Caerostris extrusa]|uniref:non-specific serine/threonine protein kinase n=1 Tax=Caerostris extrusa TaxID=172846 RepID=A0AAV4NNY7_CAEEX|nr:hypothetical protein CEXT_551051 [Caerostris extrusa]
MPKEEDNNDFEKRKTSQSQRSRSPLKKRFPMPCVCAHVLTHECFVCWCLLHEGSSILPAGNGRWQRQIRSRVRLVVSGGVYNCFDFPEDPSFQVSEEAKDLMRRLICSPECRLGQNGLEDFKNHPWFLGVNWATIRETEAPYIPEVSSPSDTSNFDVDETDLKGSDSVPPSSNSVFSGLHLPFVGFTFSSKKDLVDCHEKLKLQAKDLKDALGQRKLAMAEYAEVSDKLSELRAQKQKLSRQVRDKEEELETAMQKIDILRQDLRKAEKFRREFEARIDEAQSEATKERRLRERTEEYAHHLEDEMEALKQRHIGRAPSPVHLEALQEVNRLKMELEKMELHRNEALTEQQARYHIDITALHEQLREADITVEAMEREILSLKEKIEVTRSESSAENNEIMSELKRAHEKEKLTQVVNRQQEDRHKNDDDINHLKDKKDSIAKWESQVSEIIQWVGEEKDARSYLQALAIKMTEELENIKSSGLHSFYSYQFLKNARLARSESGDSAGAGDEADVEDNQPPSVTSSKSNASDNSGEMLSAPVSPIIDTRPSALPPKPKAHQFLVRTFVAPLKCNHCTSLMVGLIRQGAVCEVCGFACHVVCQEKVPSMCPVPADQTKRPVGIDPTRGIGTAYEGYVKVPKPGGVKKGWMRQFVVVCDFKLFLYDLAQDKSAQPYVCVSQVLDMRDEDFSVNSVLESDVIHANRKDIPCIFRITTSMMDPPGLKNQTLMLVDRESEKNKWVDALTELHRILRRNKLPSRTVFQAKEILDNTISIVKNALSAAIIDRERIVLGTEEGLYCVDLDREGIQKIARIGDGKKISQIAYVPERATFNSSVLDKSSRYQGLPYFDTACYSQGCSSNYVFCIALKRQVVLYDINRTKIRHQRRREICLPTSAQCLNVMGDRLCVGFPSSFYIYSLWEETPPFCLVNAESAALSYLCHNLMDALIAVNLPNNAISSSV